ncbi:MAG: hypothetical protein HW411_159 [Gammaproteobacteria bacterium]|nr:hypothetical protein [Gammaproteobacteria bacterium]
MRNTGKLILLIALFLSVSLQPVSADTELKQAQSLIAQGDLKQALAITDAVLAKDSKSVEARFIKGLILTKLNDLAKAEQVFLELTTEHPDLPEPYNNLAVIYAAQGQYDKAEEALQQAINTHPSYATAHENIGDIYAKMASQAYNQALELDQNNETAREKLSLIGELFSVPTPAEKVEVVQKETTVEPARRTTENVVAATPVPEPAPEIKPVQESTSEIRPVPESTSEIKLVPESVPEIKENQDVQIKETIINTVNNWADAWSRQDVNTYLSYYADEFTPAGNLSRAAWVEQRQSRLRNPKFIKVSVIKPVILMHGNEHAQVNFLQSYKSDTLDDTINKTLLMQKLNNQWLIIQEQVK